MRKIYQVAADIKNEWKNVNYAAQPYLDAMICLYDADDMYFDDSAKTVVVYFLANANSFRGEKARALKAELKQIIGIK